MDCISGKKSDREISNEANCGYNFASFAKPGLIYLCKGTHIVQISVGNLTVKRF